jgi:hypothetical protein
MGILSKKLKEHKSIQEFEEELNSLQHRIKSKMLALVGIGGRLKGLPIIYVANDDHDLKMFSAQLNEFFEPLKRLLSIRKVKDFTINTAEETLYFEPITDKVGFFADLGNGNNIFEIKHLI